MINKPTECYKIKTIQENPFLVNFTKNLVCSFDKYDENNKNKDAWPNSNITWQKYRSAESTKTPEVFLIFL